MTRRVYGLQMLAFIFDGVSVFESTHGGVITDAAVQEGRSATMEATHEDELVIVSGHEG